MTLKERMKTYEDSSRVYLPRRQPVIIRVDGQAFHTLTKNLTVPFDSVFAHMMDIVAMELAKIQNVRFAYVYSDEVSLFLIDYNKFNTEQWFGGNLQKMVSISASTAGAVFTKQMSTYGHMELYQNFTSDFATFDSRAFIIPERDVLNYFIWRQRDCIRNSIQMCARAHFSHSNLHGLNQEAMLELLESTGKPWEGLSDYWKYGRLATKSGFVKNLPRLDADGTALEQYMEIEEE